MSAHVGDRLSAYLDGELSALERNAVEAHIRDCGDCAARFDEMTAVDALARGLPAEASEDYFETLPSRVRARLEGRRPVRPWAFPVWTLAAAAAVILAVLTPAALRRGPMAPVPQVERAAPPAVATPPPVSLAPEPEDDLEAVDRLEALGYVGESDRRQRDESPKGDGSTGRAAVQPLRTPAGGSASRGGRAAAQAETRVGGPQVFELVESQDRDRALKKPAPDRPGDEATPATPPPAPVPAFAAPPPPPSEPAAPESRPETTRRKALTTEEPARRLEKGETEGRATTTASEDLAGDAEQAAPRDSEEGRFRALAARSPRTLTEAREQREAWRAHALRHPSSGRADEARVRVIEAGLAAWRLAADPADLDLLRRDAAAYLSRADARQGPRVRAALEAAEP